MRREFHFPTALVIREERLVRVRFFARPSDQMQLLIDGKSQTANYSGGSDIILLVDGGGALAEFPDVPVGEQLFAGDSIEIVFKGRFEAKTDENGLHVIVDDGELDCIRRTGLPFDDKHLLQSEVFNLLGDVTIMDKPPHKPPE